MIVHVLLYMYCTCMHVHVDDISRYLHVQSMLLYTCHVDVFGTSIIQVVDCTPLSPQLYHPPTSPS